MSLGAVQTPGYVLDENGNVFVTSTTNAANTPSAWVEWQSSIGQPYDALQFSLVGRDNSGIALIDIGVGAAGSEVVVLDGIISCGNAASIVCTSSVFWPIPRIPAGSRVAVRVQTATASDSGYQIVCNGHTRVGWNDPRALRRRVWNAGINRSTSTGQSVLPNSVYNQITSSTPYDAEGLIICVATADTTAQGGVFINAAIGGSGSEKIILTDTRIDRSTTSTGYLYNVPIPVPAGTRIAIRFGNWFSTTSSAICAVYGY